MNFTSIQRVSARLVHQLSPTQLQIRASVVRSNCWQIGKRW